ncbi:MAG TPA: hypothetical protein VF407_19180, partial [Polyangiaceae bacterium]
MARKSAGINRFFLLLSPAVLAAVAYAPLAHAQSSTVSFGASGSTDNGVQTTSSSSSTEAAPAGAPAATSEEDEWAQRDRLLGESNSLSGGTGLLHMQTAQTGAPGQLRIG